MSDPKDTGFTLPAPETAATAPAAADNQTGQLQFESAPAHVEAAPQPRDYAIGGGVLVVLLIAFFFVRGAYANTLARKRIAPGPANAAGWYLFITLASLAFGSVLGFISPAKFMTPLFLAPIGLVGIIALIMMFLSARRT